ncbi:hydrogenase maturation protein [Peribacillus huizhouensis]|uniref:Two-component system hydrogenase maturation factor HypX/HoxX n=1 Tax=Peribacillus huizhouensis TaxID=1501239 RepID=A0ABR6CMU3_9BACI|nr:hydrogenase maturation protein [Peribacillus huizhouensis]MBA9026329.1 putative two-component system hydrogenase maturation factor HypX/HoxX [Peribacillus huizhouensis]
MRILFITTSHNSLSQRAFVELTDRGHEVFVQLAGSEDQMIEAVTQFSPQLIIAPFLKTAIPELIWRSHVCIIVHPGIKGDRGPSSLDWAIMDDETKWGVTLLQADAEMDAGDIWSSQNFVMTKATKSNIYRHEVTQAAIKGLLDVIEKVELGTFIPEPLDYSKKEVKGTLRPTMKQMDRKIDWHETTEVIARKIRAADSNPGVLDTICGEEYYLFGVHEEDRLTGEPGEILAYRDGAICRATGDGAVWITHLKKKGEFKLPATMVLEDTLHRIKEAPLTPFDSYGGQTFREIYYEQKGQVGYLHFNFYNGAMSTDQCMRLKNALVEAKKIDIKVIVLMGGHDFWSNGIHLNTIENAESPADESWGNIHAMDDLVREILLTDSKLIVSAMQGNAGAGGVILALAADYVYARQGIVLNPHYKKMGGLYGSEYWTYLLPKRVGYDKAIELTEECLPISTTTAVSIGLLDESFGQSAQEFCTEIENIANHLSNSSDFDVLLLEKQRNRQADEAYKPLEVYRQEELEKMWVNFYGDDPSYHLARKNFVYKISCIVDSRPLIGSK